MNAVNKTIFTLSVIISLYLILANIFSWTPLWAIVEVLTSHDLLNIYLVYGLIMIASILNMFIGIFKRKTEVIFPFLINTLALILLVFNPFNELSLRLDIRKNFEPRSKIVQKIKEGELIPDEDGKIELPFWDRHLSKGGAVFVEKDGDLKVLFLTFRGILDNFSGLVYTSDDEKPEGDAFGADLGEVIKVKEYWYWIASW